MTSFVTFKNKAKKTFSFFKTKRFIIIISSCTFLILLGFLMFILGKSHTLYIDNSKTDNYKALNFAVVNLDKFGSLETYPGVRDSFTIVRSKHKLKLELEDGSVIEKTFKVPLFSRSLLLNLPSFVNNPDDSSKYLSEFTIKLEEKENPEEDQSSTDEFSSL